MENELVLKTAYNVVRGIQNNKLEGIDAALYD